MSVAVSQEATQSAEPILRLRGVGRRYGGLVALRDVDLDVAQGERRAVLGPNGAGKTTLFNVISGDLPPTSGTVELYGQDVTHVPARKRAQLGLARTYQQARMLLGLTVEELKAIVEDSDFDGPLVDWKKKGNKLEYLGHDDVEGTDTYKLRVTAPNGTVFTYYIDSEYNVPIKIDTKRTIRGTEREYETVVGDYKKVGGVYLPFSFESNVKGSQNASKTVYDKIEANVPINEVRFHRPAPKPQVARP